MIQTLLISIFLSLLLWIICILSTGTDQKNIKSFRSYSKEVQSILKERYDIQDTSTLRVFLSNFILFIVIFLILSRFFHQKTYLENFIQWFMIGQFINLFDFIVIDFLWFRHTKRIRFSFLPDPKYYQDMSNHFSSFYRGIIMYLLIALLIALTF